MYFSDYSKYNNTAAEIYNIGWLDPQNVYTVGEMEQTFLERLVTLSKRLRTNQSRGIYPCLFCSTFNGGFYKYEKEELFLGSAELWVPNKAFTKVFASPDLIIHYISLHHYLPPKEFIEAVNNFDTNCHWSSSLANE